MTLLLTNDEVDRLLDMRGCLDVLDQAYRELGQGIGVTRTVSQVFTPTRHSADALYSFKSMDGVAPFLAGAGVRRRAMPRRCAPAPPPMAASWGWCSCSAP